VSETPITPVPLPEGAKSPLLFGGTFDPVTRAHVELGLESMTLRGFDALVFVPAARSPHKTIGPVASDADRAEMLRLATRDEPLAAVWTDEIDRAGDGHPSYWIDTIRRARAWGLTRGVDAGAFLIGADQAGAFHRWRDARWLFDHAEPLVMLRTPADSIDDLVLSLDVSGAWSADDLDLWRSRLVETPLHDSSATSVRERLSTGDRAALIGLMDGRVLDYIESGQMYA